MGVTDRAAAVRADEHDPLAGFRDRFAMGRPGRIYLNGNSLGLLPLDTRDRLAATVDAWADRAVGGWLDWVDGPSRVGDLIGRELLGASPGEVLVCDSTTVNLYKLCAAVLDLGPRAVVTDRSNFPTDRYVLEGLATRRGLPLRMIDTHPVDGLRMADLERALAKGPALIVVSLVDYRSGALVDMRAVQELALAHEAIVVWDLSHAVGAVPVDLNGTGAQLAVGCTYKYLNAGPGAPGWLYVATSVQDALLSPIQGWFGQRDQFAMERDYDPADGVVRFLAGTPSVLGLTAVESGVAVLAEAGVGALRAKSEALTGLAIDLHREWLAPLGFELGTPSEPAQRGSHVTLRHPLAWPIKQALADRADVVTDFRPPDAIRFGIAPIYTRFTDVWDALDRLRRLVEAGEHEAYGTVPGRVT